MKEIIRTNRAFIIPYLIFLGCGIVFFLTFGKADRHLFLNQYHSKPLDLIFTYITYLGEAVPPIAFGVFFLFIKYRYLVMLALGNLLSVLVTQALKHTFDMPRPSLYFEGTHKLPVIEGVEMLFHNSFPSGHTTCAFTTFFCIALVAKSPMNKFLFFLIALSVGASRVYLSQHFFDDIYAGSIVGFTCMLIIYYFVQRWQRPWLEKKLVL